MSLFTDASLVMIPSGIKDQKIYSVTPTDGSGDLTFTRSNDTATRVASNGLIEKVRTNLLTYSEDLTNAAWANFSITVSANATTAPNGTTTADKITPTTSNINHLIHSNVITSAGEYSFSVYVKAAGYSKVALRESQSVGFFASFDLTSGTILDSSTFQTNTITSVGDGWYRITSTRSFSGGINLGLIPLEDSYTSGIPLTAYAGDGTSGIFAWGAQMEYGVPTPYIGPTTTAAVSVGPVANLPRLDYSGGATCPKLLLEGQRTNAITFSEQMDNAAWTKLNATISANTTDTLDPSGYNGADKITDDTTNGAHIAYRLSTWDTTQRTASVYAKAGTASKISIQNASTGQGAFFDLSTGTITALSAPFTATITEVGNGWYRLTTTHTAGSSQTFSIGLYEGTATYIYAGTGSYAYIWGAQLEAGAYATSYIPTLGAAVTRGEDVGSKTGISSLIGQTEGTIFMEVDVLNGTGIQVGNSASASDYVNSIQITITPSSTNAGAHVGGVLQFSTASAGRTGMQKIAVAYGLNNYAFYINGTQIATDSSATVPAMSAIIFNHVDLGATNGKIAQTLLFPTRLSNSDLAALTA